MTSTAASAQYPVTCPSCKAAPFTPCRAKSSGRVTDTHLSRIDAAYGNPAKGIARADR